MPAPFLVTRQRLEARLDVPTPLTLVRGPIGFGKSTLVAQWIRARPRSAEIALWVRVRPGAGDAASFWATALQVAADAGLSVPSAPWNGLTQEAGGLLERAVQTSKMPVVLVVDGFEHVTSSDIDLALLDLLRHTPRLRLVVCLRNYRSFPANRRLDLETTALAAHDLRFTEDETRELLTAAGVDLSPDDVRRIVEEFAGWPEPTRALVQRLRTSAEVPIGNLAKLTQGIAAEYLHERILSTGHPPALVEFALLTSLPESFTVEVAELLSDDDLAKSHLDALDREGLLMEERQDGQLVHRWSAAARQALRDELGRRWPERLGDLHGRLARKYVDEGQTGPALRHAVSAADWPLVIEIIESSWRTLVFHHNDDLYRAFSAMPTKFLMASPRALAMRDTKMRVPDNLFFAAATLPESLSQLTALGRREDAADLLDTYLSLLFAWRARGELGTARTYGARLLTIAEAARIARSAEVSSLYPTLQLQVGITHLLGGGLDAAIQPLQTAFERGADNPLGYIERDAAGKLALAHAISGDHVQTSAWLDRHESCAMWGHTWLEPHIRSPAIVARLLTALDRLELEPAVASHDQLAAQTHREEFWSYVVHARAQHALTVGAASEALTIVDRARTARSHLMGPGAVAAPLLAAAEADLLLALGRGNLARTVLSGPDRDHPLLRVPQARLALLTGQNDVAVQMTQDSSWDRIATARNRLEMLLIRTVAAARIGDVEGAKAGLRRAVDAARAGGMLRPFASVPREELLALAVEVPAARDLLDKEPLAQQPDLFPSSIRLIELSIREQQVLQQLAEGMTVPQIADSSVLSYNTVRSQQRSLYKKLGTSDRSEAIARARQWGLLPLGPEGGS